MSFIIIIIFSSFSISKNKIIEIPYAIYHEYRLHTIKSIFIIILSLLDLQIINYFLVITFHLIEDLVSYLNGLAGITNVRNNNYKNIYEYILQRLYSYYNLLSICTFIIPNKYMADLGFNTLIVIQISPFLNTLYKKNIIKLKVKNLINNICLLFSTYYIYKT